METFGGQRFLGKMQARHPSLGRLFLQAGWGGGRQTLGGLHCRKTKAGQVRLLSVPLKGKLAHSRLKEPLLKTLSRLSRGLTPSLVIRGLEKTISPSPA